MKCVDLLQFYSPMLEVVSSMCSSMAMMSKPCPTYVQCHCRLCWCVLDTNARHKFVTVCPHAAVRAADVIVVVSGTDGALASVVAGLVETPVVSLSCWSQAVSQPGAHIVVARAASFDFFCLMLI